MEITVGLRIEELRNVAKTGLKPDFDRVFADFSDVTHVKTFGRGRFATFEIAPDILPELEKKFAEKFTFSPKMSVDFP